MTFLTLYTELGDRLGAYDPAVSSDLTKLKRWINMGIQYICGKRLWPFMLAEETIQTVADITTGTVETIQGSNNLVFSSAPTVSVAGRFIQTASSNDWYKITSHAANTTTANMATVAVATASADTFKVRKLLYTTTTPLTQILDMKQLVTPARIISQSPREADYFLSLYYSAGNPYYYIMSTPTSAGTPQFSFIYSPDSAMNIMVRGIQNLTDLSSDSDVPVIPTPWQDAIINIAAFYGFQSLNDTRANTELQVGEARIKDMMTNYSHDLGRHRVMSPIVNDSNFGLQWALPSTFGPPV